MDQSILWLAPTPEMFLGQGARAVDVAAAALSRVPAPPQGRGHGQITLQLHGKTQTLAVAIRNQIINTQFFFFFFC